MLLQKHFLKHSNIEKHFRCEKVQNYPPALLQKNIFFFYSKRQLHSVHCTGPLKTNECWPKSFEEISARSVIFVEDIFGKGRGWWITIFFQAYLPAPDWLGVWLSWKHPAKLSLWKIVFLLFRGNKFNFVIIFQKRVENLKVESKLLHEAESNINLPGGQCKRITLWKFIWTDLQGIKCSDCYHISQFSTICIVAKICNFKTLPFAKSEPRHDKDKAPRHSILPLASDDKRECHSLNGETAMLSSMADCPMIVRKSRTQLMRLV